MDTWVRADTFVRLPLRRRRYVVSVRAAIKADIRPEILTALRSDQESAPGYVESLLRVAFPGFLPDGALLEAVGLDIDTYGLSFYYSHPSFDVVPEGEHPPVFRVEQEVSA